MDELGIGDMVAGRYRIVRSLNSSGGMGVVWLAEERALARRVAIKTMASEQVLTSRGWNYGALKERFELEYRATATLDHPALPAIYHAGTLPGGLPYYVMQLLAGKTIHELLERRGPTFLISEAACFGLQLCSVLAAAHERGIVHRDLKPENLIVLKSGLLKIIDFGIAYVVDTNRRITTSHSPGSTGFMAPEVYSGRSPGSPAADIYALGALIYMLLGGPVFRGDTATIDRALLTAIPDPLSSRNPRVPAELAELVDQMLLQNPDERPADVREVAARLAPWIPAVDRLESTPTEHDLTRPFRTPCALPIVEAGNLKLPQVRIETPELTPRRVFAELTALEQEWEQGDRLKVVEKMGDLLRRVRRQNNDLANELLDIGPTHCRYLKEVGRYSEARAELEWLRDAFGPKLGSRHPAIQEIIQQIEALPPDRDTNST
ncbi:serine/threonine-protein kinase [Actinocorallia sp. A-T 12471]|uniref:serine/threonine-protein kinase n=1 Tax=Actinocorallia sp. A-T 12471 TaxID=3089813 RepID=UPI0029CE0345|nr:serine/threonine-protein kinase [Actinocorallia sp. A-T 12471]MDX6738457.1 serine/threonine-protein kinase [Actinocorallia sp. A-T 12471]